jgi:hypothetical protein
MTAETRPANSTIPSYVQRRLVEAGELAANLTTQELKDAITEIERSRDKLAALQVALAIREGRDPFYWLELP